MPDQRRVSETRLAWYKDNRSTIVGVSTDEFDLAADLQDARKQLEEFLDIVRHSHGVAGWYADGSIATWEELGVDR